MLFRKRCNADGLDPKDCGGEGDCQMHSLIHELQVKGLGTFSIAQLRGKVADELEAGRESLLLKRSESLLLNYFDANVISGMQCSSVGLGWQLVTPKLAASRE